MEIRINPAAGGKLSGNNGQGYTCKGPPRSGRIPIHVLHMQIYKLADENLPPHRGGAAAGGKFPLENLQLRPSGRSVQIHGHMGTMPASMAPCPPGP